MIAQWGMAYGRSSRAFVMVGLHRYLDSGNLRRLITKNVYERRDKLPELRGDRAVVGVDNELPQLQIGHPRALS